MAELFLCLASAEDAGLLFLPVGVSATHKRLQWLFCRQCNYTAKAPKPFTGRYSGISVDLPYSSAHNTAATQAAYTPPAPHRTLYRSAQPPYYNKVYKSAGVRPCYESMPDSAAYRRPCQPGGVSSCHVRIRWQVLTRCQQYRPGAPAEGSASPPVQGQPGGGRRGTIGGYRRNSFRAFAR